MCEFSAFWHIFKTNIAQSVTELEIYSQKHEMWSYTIKFGELRYKNVNNTFMLKKDSQSHTRLEHLDIYQLLLVVAVLISNPSTGSRHYRNGGLQGRKGPSQAFYGHYKLLRMATLGLGQKSWFLQFLSPSKIFSLDTFFLYSVKSIFPDLNGIPTVVILLIDLLWSNF